MVFKGCILEACCQTGRDLCAGIGLRFDRIVPPRLISIFKSLQLLILDLFSGKRCSVTHLFRRIAKIPGRRVMPIIMHAPHFLQAKCATFPRSLPGARRSWHAGDQPDLWTGQQCHQLCSKAPAGKSDMSPLNSPLERLPRSGCRIATKHLCTFTCSGCGRWQCDSMAQPTRWRRTGFTKAQG